MSIENAVRRRALLLERIGKTGLNIKYPDEFELYVIALELLDENMNTLKYFIFPVMPDSLEEDSQQLHSIKKTLNGVHVLTTTNFIPTDISLSGTFGRRLRILLNGKYEDFVSSFKTPQGTTSWTSLKGGTKQFFDENVKTGYGCTKILESMINDTNVIDDNGGVKTLVFHNLALGNSYIVRPQSLRLSQSQQSNMIWNYSLKLKSLAPLSALYSSQQLTDNRISLAKGDFLQKRLDDATNILSGFITKADDRFTERVQKPGVRRAKDYIRDRI